MNPRPVPFIPALLLVLGLLHCPLPAQDEPDPAPANAVEDTQEPDEPDAIADLRTEVAERTARLGPEHPDTLASRADLAAALHTSGKHAEAEGKWRALVPDLEGVLGKEHPDTLRCRFNLALCLWDLERRKEAIEEADAAKAGFRKVLGNRHPWTAEARTMVRKWRKKTGDESVNSGGQAGAPPDGAGTMP